MVIVVNALPSASVTVYVMVTSDSTGAGEDSGTSVPPEETVVVIVTMDGRIAVGERPGGAVAVTVITSRLEPIPPGNVIVKTVKEADAAIDSLGEGEPSDS